MSHEQQTNYELVKEAVLKAYQITPEFYRSKFRNMFKEQNQNFVEYSHSLLKPRGQLLKSSGVTTYDQLCELLDLGQFLRGIPAETRTYLCERKFITLERAAALSENYHLIHQSKKKVND